MKILEKVVQFCIGFNVNSHSIFNRKNFVNLERRNRFRRKDARDNSDRRDFAEQVKREDIYLNKKAG